jgi:hypothetical protein
MHDHDVHTFRAEEAEHAVTDAYTKRELADLDYDPTEQQHTAWLHEINPVKDSPAVWVEKDARLPKWQSSGLINRYCGQQYDSPFENHRDIPALYREHHAAHTDWDKVQKIAAGLPLTEPGGAPNGESAGDPVAGGRSGQFPQGAARRANH